MSKNDHMSGRLERLSWLTLLATVGLAPLAVSKLPGTATPLTFTVFAYPQSVTLIVGVGLTLLLWAASRFIGSKTLLLAPQMIGFGLFAAWSVIATVAGFEPLRSLFGSSGSALSLIHIIAYTELAFLAVQLLDTRERMMQLSWVVVCSATIVAGLALLQQLFGLDLFGRTVVEDWIVGRGFSTMGNPDQLGTFLVLPSIVAGFLAAFEATRSRRLTAAALATVLVAALVGTLTRGAWLGLASGVVVAASLAFRVVRDSDARRSVAIVGVLMAAAIGVAFLASDYADLQSRFAPSTPAAVDTEAAPLERVNAISSDRINVWRSALGVTADRPITGTGPAAFELGWYSNAIDPKSAGGTLAIADDVHSVVLFVLATTGVPGILFYLFALGAALAVGTRTSIALTRERIPSGKSLYYVGWFAGAVGLQVSLLLGAVTAPIVMLSFLSLALLVRPATKLVELPHLGSFALNAALVTLAFAMIVSAYAPLAAETALARAVRGSVEEAPQAVETVWWNMDVQRGYYAARVEDAQRKLAMAPEDALTTVDGLSTELVSSAERQPREFYYPALRAKLLTDASGAGAGSEYAEAAVEASDEALAIMPENLSARVQKAIALSDLGRFEEMAETLENHWETELTSAYPGILYAQALAFSGETEESGRVFDLLASRFPAEKSAIDAARAQTEVPPAE